MTLNEYIKQSYTRPNIQVLKSLGASDKLIQYLLKTPWNTNMAMIDSLASDSAGGIEPVSWPKLIHIIYDNGLKIANDSDFSTFTEAYNFIKSNWETGNRVSSEYIILKHIDTIIESDCYVRDNRIEWYSNDTVYSLNENSYSSYDDN